MPIDHFSLIAGIYNRVETITLPDEVIELFNPSSNDLLMDAGGGTGRVAEAFSKKVRSIIVTDLSLKMLYFAMERGFPSVHTTVESSPFSDAAFDKIIIVDAFHHFCDQKKVIDELWRVLKVKGRILIIEPNIHKFGVKLIAFTELLLLMNSHFRSAEYISDQFNRKPSKIWIIDKNSTIHICIEKVR